MNYNINLSKKWSGENLTNRIGDATPAARIPLDTV